jgi:plasmid replication initiation protein
MSEKAKTPRKKRKEPEVEVRHLELASQMELFLGDLMVPATKDDRASMEHPFFSIRKGGDKTIRKYEDPRSKARLEIHPSTKGSATIWDKDILIYLGSVLRRAMDGEVMVAPTFTFTAQDLLRSIGRNSGGQDYKDLEAALDRLVGTRVKTNIATGEHVVTENFNMLDSYQLLGTRSGRLDKVRVTVSHWFYRAIESKEILSIPPKYFEIRGGLERRLYEIIRKHCGSQASFAIGLDRLYLKSGSTSPERRFRFEVRQLVGKDFGRLLDYFLALDENNLYAFSDTHEGRTALGKLIGARAKRALPSPAEVD